MPYESAREQWEEGMRRLDEAYPEQAATLEREARRLGMVKAGERAYIVK